MPERSIAAAAIDAKIAALQQNYADDLRKNLLEAVRSTAADPALSALIASLVEPFTSAMVQALTPVFAEMKDGLLALQKQETRKAVALLTATPASNRTN